MKFQLNSFYCGPAVIAAATRALGCHVGQQFAAKLAGTTDAGTDEVGIKRALLARGLIPEEFNQSTQLAAKHWLIVKLKLGYPVIMCLGRQRWEHWTCILGMLGNRYIFFDPARFEYRINSGITVLSWDSLMRLWYAPKSVRGRHGKYYAIGVMKGPPK